MCVHNTQTERKIKKNRKTNKFMAYIRLFLFCFKRNGEGGVVKTEILTV